MVVMAVVVAMAVVVIVVWMIRYIIGVVALTACIRVVTPRPTWPPYNRHKSDTMRVSRLNCVVTPTTMVTAMICCCCYRWSCKNSIRPYKHRRFYYPIHPPCPLLIWMWPWPCPSPIPPYSPRMPPLPHITTSSPSMSNAGCASPCSTFNNSPGSRKWPVPTRTLRP